MDKYHAHNACTPGQRKDTSSACVAQGGIQKLITDHSVGDAVIERVADSAGVAQGGHPEAGHKLLNGQCGY